MLEDFDPIRYSVIEEKNKREIVMLRGRGCAWRRCRFCDYHLDYNQSDTLNYQLNQAQLAQVTGQYQTLEVINSGSFIDLDENTMEEIFRVCQEKGIRQIHFECHYMHKEMIPQLRARFAAAGVAVKMKIGVETFDYLFRESYLDKGITEEDPAMIAEQFDECCLLQGIPGQTVESMISDIETGLRCFERVCVNIMRENSKQIKPAPKVIQAFVSDVYPRYKDDARVDILLENTDFGVGGEK